MNVRDIMSATVDSIDAEATISYTARRMADDDTGALPVLSNGKLVGIVTDRDIAVRAVAEGIPGSAPVRRVMTRSVECCAPGDDVGTLLALMSRKQVRRMPVCNADDDVIGIVSLADVARLSSGEQDVGATLADVCAPRGQHCQTALYA